MEIERLPLEWQVEGDGGWIDLICVKNASSTEGGFCNQHSQDLTVCLVPVVKVIFQEPMSFWVCCETFGGTPATQWLAKMNGRSASFFFEPTTTHEKTWGLGEVCVCVCVSVCLCVCMCA